MPFRANFFFFSSFVKTVNRKRKMDWFSSLELKRLGREETEREKENCKQVQFISSYGNRHNTVTVLSNGPI